MPEKKVIAQHLHWIELLQFSTPFSLTGYLNLSSHAICWPGVYSRMYPVTALRKLWLSKMSLKQARKD